MNLGDLRFVPFSRSGSYLAFSVGRREGRAGSAPGDDTLYLRTVRGDRTASEVFAVEAVLSAEPDAPAVACALEATPTRLILRASGGEITLFLTNNHGVRIRGTGTLGLRLTLVRPGAYGHALPFDTAGRWLVNAWDARMVYLLTPLAGTLTVDAPPGVLRCERVAATFLPDVGGTFEARVEEMLPTLPPAPPRLSFDDEAAGVERDWSRWRDGLPAVADPVLADAAEQAAYVQWASVVAADGHFRRPAMFMSKNHMTNVWSWDHCFNALSLWAHEPALAWDQLLLPFDHQGADGALPDCVNDKTIVRNFTKPPIHGWALAWMWERDRSGFLTGERLAEIYGPLARWTDWWLRFRDHDNDGVPQYNHGNDCGWDNATSFDVGFPVEGPDLCAFLALQMNVLARAGETLGRDEEAASWRERSRDLLDKLVAHSWRGDRFVAPRSGDHAVVDPGEADSLFPFLPLVLGERLPAEMRAPLVAGLTEPGRFLTDYGLATESVRSARYEPDGYWRGPIWAPPVMLLADGLRRAGETAVAADIARRFCRAVAKSGSAENFDALTGDALRDRAYTWTSSVFLVLAREYLAPEETA